MDAISAYMLESACMLESEVCVVYAHLQNLTFVRLVSCVCNVAQNSFKLHNVAMRYRLGL